MESTQAQETELEPKDPNPGAGGENPQPGSEDKTIFGDGNNEQKPVGTNDNGEEKPAEKVQEEPTTT